MTGRKCPWRGNHGFTLIELLIVIGLVAVLSIAIVVLLSPAQLLKQARDSSRFSDVNSINKAISLYQLDIPGGFMGNASTVYYSIADPTATTTGGTDCSGVGMNNPAPGWAHHCASSSTLRLTDGTGWLPIDLDIVIARTFSRLPIDPLGSGTSSYYSYIPGFALSVPVESAKYTASHGNLDDGYDPSRHEVGQLSLIAQSQGLIGWWKLDEGAGTTARDSSGSGIGDMTLLNNASMLSWVDGNIAGGLKYSDSAPTDCSINNFGISLDPAASFLSLPQGDFTLAWWDDNATDRYFYFTLWTDQACGGGEGIRSYLNSNWVAVAACNSLGQTAMVSFNGAPSAGVWHHYAYVFKKSTDQHSLYLNGVHKSTNALSGSYGSLRASDSINMGIYVPSCAAAAKGTRYDDIRLYRRALNATEINALYQANR